MGRQTPELPRLQRRAEIGHTLVSITSLRGLRRLLLAVIVLQALNLLFEVAGVVS